MRRLAALALLALAGLAAGCGTQSEAMDVDGAMRDVERAERDLARVDGTCDRVNALRRLGAGQWEIDAADPKGFCR